MSTDLNAVAVFMKVVEMKNFRAAARALGLPKSTVSLKVARLEDHLGARLIERTTRTLRLTDAGNAYCRRVAPALDALNDAERAVNDLQTEPAGQLRITTTIEFGQNSPIFAEALADYLQRYPAVEVQVDLIDRRVDLVEEGFDLAIRAGILADSTLIARPLGAAETLRVHASPAYLRRHGEPRHPDELADHECLVMTSQSQPTTWHFRSMRKSIAINIRPRIAVNGFLVLRALAVAGLGVTRLPHFLGASAIQAGTLRTVLDEFAQPPSHWHAVYPSARNLSPKVRALLEILVKRFSADHSDPGQTSGVKRSVR